MSSKVCATCIYAGGFSIGPGISGADEGVKCSNSEFARYLDRLQKSDSYEKEYNRQVNLYFRTVQFQLCWAIKGVGLSLML